MLSNLLLTLSVAVVFLLALTVAAAAVQLDNKLFEEGVPAIYYKRKPNQPLAPRSVLIIQKRPVDSEQQQQQQYEDNANNEPAAAPRESARVLNDDGDSGDDFDQVFSRLDADDRCRRPRFLNETCCSSQQCSSAAPNSFCDPTGVTACSCNENFVPYGNDTCLPVQRRLGGACTITAQCILSGTQCSNNTCQYVEHQRKNLGDECADDAECGGIVGAECANNMTTKKCACRSLGYVRTSPTTCTETIETLYNATCATILQCTQRYSTCAVATNFFSSNSTNATTVAPALRVPPQCICDFAYQFAYPANDRKSCCSFQDHAHLSPECQKPFGNSSAALQMAFANFALVYPERAAALQAEAMNKIVVPSQQNSTAKMNL